MTTADISQESVAMMIKAPWCFASADLSDVIRALSSALQQAKSQVSADQYWMSEAAKLGAMVERLTDEVATACETNSRLSSALTQSRDETAAAYDLGRESGMREAAGMVTYTKDGMIDCDVPVSFRAAILAAIDIKGETK